MRIREHIQSAALLLLAFSLFGCNENKFQRIDNKGKKPVETPPPPAEEPPPEEEPIIPEPVTETFDLNFARTAIDMVWVIDNSGSMRNEAEQVRLNFTNFITKLSATTDFKLALISSRLGETGVDLSAIATGANLIQHDVFVNSRNPLAIVASATCPYDAPPADENTLKICGADFSGAPGIDEVTAQDSIFTVSGKLASFYRQEAKKIFVIVTDDDAILVNDTNFLDLIKGQVTSPFQFAFRGVQTVGTCTIAKRGVSYENLATKTGGEVYDICEPDWSAHFTKLMDSVEKIATTTFTLKSANIELVAVKIDGTEIGADLYVLKGDVLEIKPEAFKAGQKNIEVIYKVK